MMEINFDGPGRYLVKMLSRGDIKDSDNQGVIKLYRFEDRWFDLSYYFKAYPQTVELFIGKKHYFRSVRDFVFVEEGSVTEVKLSENQRSLLESDCLFVDSSWSVSDELCCPVCFGVAEIYPGGSYCPEFCEATSDYF